MNMISNTADDERRTFPLREDARLIGVKNVHDVFWNPRFAVFRTVDEMDQILDQGLRHGEGFRIVSPFQGEVLM